MRTRSRRTSPLQKKIYAPNALWNADTLALLTQAVIQGAFILAKAQGKAEIATQCIAHLRCYVEGLLTPGSPFSKPIAKEKP